MKIVAPPAKAAGHVVAADDPFLVALLMAWRFGKGAPAHG